MTARNSPCPCGSGIKYKRCCGREDGVAPSPRVDLEPLVREGLACHQRGEYQKAEVAYSHVLAQDPGHVDALHFMGVLAHEFGKNDLAVELISRAMASGGSAGMHYNLGQALRALGRLSEAAAQYAAATVLEPHWADPFVNLGTTELECGRVNPARLAWQRALDLEPSNAAVLSNLLMSQLYDPTADASAIAALHRQLGARFEVRGHQKRGAQVPEAPQGPGAMKIGFVSGDFRRHPVGLLLKDVLRALSGQGLQVYMYSNNPADDDVTRALRSQLPNWQDIRTLDDESACDLIRSQGIDILVDLSGHTGHNRMGLFALRAAPRQVTWLGYGTTTGLVEMDHILVDPWCVSPTEAADYQERLQFLPRSRIFYSRPLGSPPVAELPALRNGFVTFGCFNHLAKLNSEVLALWAQLLTELPTARLMLKARQYSEPLGRSHLVQLLEGAGIDARRCDVAPYSSPAEYLGEYSKVDIALDPFPFTGGTTTLDGLWMGVPAVTLRCGHMIGRQTASINRNLGLDDWTAGDRSDYLERVVRHAGDLRALASLRAELRDRLAASSICDTNAFAKDLAEAFRAIGQYE